MFEGRSYKSTPLTAAVLATLYPSLSPAQETPPAPESRPEAGKLETIIVTATRRELNLQEVGQSVTAFSTADIERQALQDVEDVVNALPSVNMVNSMPGRNAIFMRGIATGSAEYYVDSQVSIYLDDQPLTSVSQQVEIQPIDIERIESLPGPQGTLFGSSSQAGTIRYITNRPDTDGYSSQLDLEIGSIEGGEETYDVSGHLNIPVNDSFAVRLVGFYTLEGGWVDNVLGEDLRGVRTNADVVEDDFNEYEFYGGRIAARWLINPKWESTLSLISQYGYAEGSWDSDPALGDYKITRFLKEWREDDWYQASLNVKGDLGFAELSATASYFDRSIDYVWDGMDYDQWRSAHAHEAFYPTIPGVQYTWYAIYDTDTLIGRQYNWQTQRRDSYEIRLTSLGESRFQWMAGLFYEDVNDWWDYGKDLPGLEDTRAWDYAQGYAFSAQNYDPNVQYPLAPTDLYYQNIFDKTVKQKAVFGEVTYDLTEKWSVTGGMRWFEYDRDEVETSEVPRGLPLFEPETGTFTGGRIVSSGTDSDTVFKFATQYRFDDDRMVYFLYSEGFRLGGNNSARAASTGLIPLTYLPDKLENYEVGLKSTWLDDRLQFNISAFLMEWTDFQLNVGTDIWWARGIFNGNDAEQRGIEAEAVWNVTANFVLEGSIFLGDPEFSEETLLPSFDPAEPDPDDVLEAGTPIPLSPEQKYRVAAEYTFPSFLGSNGDFWTRWSYTYQGDTWKDVDAVATLDPNQHIDSWSTSDLQFGFSHNTGWDVSLIIRNLFDENGVRWLSAADYGSLFNDPRYRYVRTLEQPRTISIAFSKKW